MNSVVLTLSIGLAGAFGAVARYSLGRFISSRLPVQFPVSTFCINLLGAFLIGLIFSLTTQKVLIPLLQSILATGFLGGFTTFSTLSWEGVQLARSGQRLQSLLYLGSSFVLGPVVALLGLVLGKGL